MNPSLLSQLDEFARGLVPLGLTLLLVLLETSPLPIPNFATVAPALSLSGLYYWALHRPDLMPPAAVFCVGALLDIVSGTSLGVNALVLLVAYGAVLSQRRFVLGKPFAIVWFGFLLTVVLAGLLGWIILSVLNGHVLNPQRLMAQTVVTVLVYPVVAWVVGRMHRRFVRDPKS